MCTNNSNEFCVAAGIPCSFQQNLSYAKKLQENFSFLVEKVDGNGLLGVSKGLLPTGDKIKDSDKKIDYERHARMLLHSENPSEESVDLLVEILHSLSQSMCKMATDRAEVSFVNDVKAYKVKFEGRLVADFGDVHAAYKKDKTLTPTLRHCWEKNKFIGSSVEMQILAKHGFFYDNSDPDYKTKKGFLSRLASKRSHDMFCKVLQNTAKRVHKIKWKEYENEADSMQYFDSDSLSDAGKCNETGSV